MSFKFGDLLGSFLLVSNEKDAEIFFFLEANWYCSMQLKDGLSDRDLVSHIKCEK